MQTECVTCHLAVGQLTDIVSYILEVLTGVLCCFGGSKSCCFYILVPLDNFWYISNLYFPLIRLLWHGKFGLFVSFGKIWEKAELESTDLCVMMRVIPAMEQQLMSLEL